MDKLLTLTWALEASNMQADATEGSNKGRNNKQAQVKQVTVTKTRHKSVVGKSSQDKYYGKGKQNQGYGSGKQNSQQRVEATKTGGGKVCCRCGQAGHYSDNYQQ